jgi:hypothetical protein
MGVNLKDFSTSRTGEVLANSGLLCVQIAKVKTSEFQKLRRFTLQNDKGRAEFPALPD